MVEFAEVLSSVFGIDVQLNGDGSWKGTVTREQWRALSEAVAGKNAVAVPA